MCDVLPDLRQHRNREEDSTEVCQGCEDKIRYDRCRVEAICHESIQQSDEREEERSQEGKEECESDMSKGYVSEKECYREYDTTCHESAYHTPSDESCDDHWIWSWRDEDLFDGFLELRHVERGYHMRKRVHDHTHHHESWYDELHI